MTHLDIIHLLAVNGYTYEILKGGRFVKEGMRVTIATDGDTARLDFSYPQGNAKGSLNLLTDGLDLKESILMGLKEAEKVAGISLEHEDDPNPGAAR